MTALTWIQQAAAIAPLLNHVESGTGPSAASVIERIFATVTTEAGFCVHLGSASVGIAILGLVVERRGWAALYLDHGGSAAPEDRSNPIHKTGIVAATHVSAENINALLEQSAVPHNLDCMIIDIAGQDYWVWNAIESTYKPYLVIIEFNAYLGFEVSASIRRDDAWVSCSDNNRGASFVALCDLAQRKGYKLVHVHGPWKLFFVRSDIPFSVELSVKLPLTEPQLQVLTESHSAHRALLNNQSMPPWMNAEPPDVTREPWEILTPILPTKIIDLYDISLEVLADKYDVTWYQQRKTYEERVSLLYEFLATEGFTNFVDVGANVGFISLLARRACPSINIVALEADPRLARLIKRNFDRHGLRNAHVVNAIAGQHNNPNSTFSLNPGSTLDNRVSMAKWPQVHIPSTRLDSLLMRLKVTEGRTFFKIDTQGYEMNILKGLESWLDSSSNWIIKMEFAPDWLSSQGTDPSALLDYLQLRYEFAEFPERIAFGTMGFEQLFSCPITFRQQSKFLAHVCALNKNQLGWVDLLVRSRH